MLDVFILSSVTYKLIQKRSKKQEDKTSPEVEVLEGRGDQIFSKLGGEKFYQGEAIGIFFFFLFLRVALYAPIYSFSLAASGGKYGVVDLQYSDRLQDEIVRFGIQGMTLLVPVWLPVVAGLNLVNQLDKDFPHKQVLKRLARSCEVDRDFSSCEKMILFHYMDDTPENFEKGLSYIQNFMTDEKQICVIYRFRSEYTRRLKHLKGLVHIRGNEDCNYEICSGCRYW